MFVAFKIKFTFALLYAERIRVTKGTVYIYLFCHLCRILVLLECCTYEMITVAIPFLSRDACTNAQMQFVQSATRFERPSAYKSRRP